MTIKCPKCDKIILNPRHKGNIIFGFCSDCQHDFEVIFVKEGKK